MEFFALAAMIPMTTGGGNQLDSSRYLDVPSLSLRNPLLPELLLHPSRIPDWFGRLPPKYDSIVDTRHPGLRGHFAAFTILQHHFWQQILYVEAHNSEEDVALEKEATSRVGFVNEEKEGVYDPALKRPKEEQAAWQLDRTYETETNWGVNNEDLEVVSRVSLPFPSSTRRVWTLSLIFRFLS